MSTGPTWTDPRRRRRPASGQSLVEFAVVLPMFLLLLTGVFDGGRLVYMNTVLSQAAREAARAASVEASWVGSTDPSCNTWGGPICPSSFDALLNDATSAANRMVTPFATIPKAHISMRCDRAGAAPAGNWTGQSCSSASPGSVVSVRVDMTYEPITPFVGSVVPSISLSGFATMTID
jgi:hypothetical protein